MKRLNYTKLEVTVLKIPLYLQNSSPMDPPHVLGIPVEITPLSFGIPRCRPWYRYGYFLEPPIEIPACDILEPKSPIHTSVFFYSLGTSVSLRSCVYLKLKVYITSSHQKLVFIRNLKSIHDPPSTMVYFVQMYKKQNWSDKKSNYKTKFITGTCFRNCV